MNIADAATRMLATRIVSPLHQRQILAHVRHFAARYGACLDALSDEHANAWIDGLRAARSPKTVKAYRSSLLSVWRFAWDCRLVETPPLRVKTVKVPRQPPTAWTIDEIRLLLAACHKLCHRQRRRWALAFIHVTWSTGLRATDVYRVRLEDLAPDGTLRMSQHKTGDGIAVTLSPVAIAALGRVGGQVPRRSRESLSRLFRDLVEISGVRAGTARWLRRSAASYYERERPGCGAKFLGHRTPGMAERHYFDPAIVGTVNGTPPEL